MNSSIGMSSYRPGALGAAAAVFFVCFLTGMWLASVKPVWNDELYTQTTSVDKPSYWKIITLKFEEGNATPVYYLVQKGICDLLGYRFPGKWTGAWEVSDPRSQVLMRVNPVLFMSLSVALIFYFFLLRYSWPAAIYALAVTLSSFMVWSYWAEARPYALWMFLTTVQAVIFLLWQEGGGRKERYLRWLIISHIALSFTVIFGMLQIITVALMVWWAGEKRWRVYIPLAVLPVAVCVFYFVHSPHFKFFFLDSPMELIGASIPKDRFLILFTYAVALGVHQLHQRRRFPSPFVPEARFMGGHFLGLTALLVVAAVVLLIVFQMDSVYKRGFQISNRYFIFLAPVGIIAVTLFSIEMWRALRGKMWWQAALAVFLGGLLVLRALRTFELARKLYF